MGETQCASTRNQPTHIMIIRPIPAILWLLGFALIVGGAARFGWHTASIVGGAILLKSGITFHLMLTKGWKS